MRGEKSWAVAFYFIEDGERNYVTDKFFKKKSDAVEFMNDKAQVDEFIDKAHSVQSYIKKNIITKDDIKVEIYETELISIF